MAERDPSSIGDILDRLDTLGRDAGDGEVVLGDVIAAMGHRSYGPFLIVLPLIEISPVGGIPGIPTFLAAVIALIAVQMLIGRTHLWLPGFVERRGASGGKVRAGVAKLRGAGERMDRWFHGRLPGLTRGPAVQVAALSCIVLAATVPPLELLPFASTAPMLAIAAFGLALTVRDGALMVGAALMAVAAIAIGVGLWGGG